MVTMYYSVSFFFIIDPFFLSHPRVPLQVPLFASVMEYFCITMSFCYFNGVSVWIENNYEDDPPPHIATLFKQLVSANFGDDRIISRHFRTAT